MKLDSKIYVAGSKGLVGSAIARALRKAGYNNLLCPSHDELDLREQREVRDFFKRTKPEYVFLAAAKVGGIQANSTYPAQFIYENLMIECNVMDAAYLSGCKKLLFLGSSCIYPKFATQPIAEEELLTGSLEPTNECYALAKISGIRMGQAFRRQYGFDVISAMPTNLYGPGDNFNPKNSHVLPALIRRFHEAKIAEAPSVTIWGTGKPLREFMHVYDLADACLFLMDNYSDSLQINVGSGQETSILDLAKMVALCVDYSGEILTDPAMPDGTPRKLVNPSRLFGMGWRPKIGLAEGIKDTYQWYLQNLQNIREK